MATKVTLELTGKTPLLCHNVRLADPDDEFAQRLKEITEDRTFKKTEEGRRAMEKIEWFGSLYTENGSGPMLPTTNIRRCFERAATTYKKGKDVTKSVHFQDVMVPIAYEGPSNINKLWEKPEFRSRLMVRIGQQRVPRCRPQFPRWAVVAEAILIEDVLDFRLFKTIVELAGQAEGLGDNRTNGYGRFDINVAKHS
jgi:hypothetical protein